VLHHSLAIVEALPLDQHVLTAVAHRHHPAHLRQAIFVSFVSCFVLESVVSTSRVHLTSDACRKCSIQCLQQPVHVPVQTPPCAFQVATG